MASVLVYAIYLFTEIITAALIIRALLSWFARDPYSPLGKIYGVLIRFTEPWRLSPKKMTSSRLNFIKTLSLLLNAKRKFSIMTPQTITSK